MRKTLAILAALVALAALPGSAFADNPDAIYDTLNNPAAGIDVGQRCLTPWSSGVQGAFGANGYFIDGCTAHVKCPVEARTCNVRAKTWIHARQDGGDVHATQNARLRAISTDGQVFNVQDASCADRTWWCGTPEQSVVIGPGQSATIQCNGVVTADVKAENTCSIYLVENFA